MNSDKFNNLNNNIPNPYDPSINPHLVNQNKINEEILPEENKVVSNPFEIKNNIFNQEIKEQYNENLNQSNNYNINYNRNEKFTSQKNKMIFKYLIFGIVLISVVLVIYLLYNIFVR